MQQKNILSHEDFELVLSLWPDMFFLADKDGVILDANPACERVLEYPRNEIVGESWEKFVHPEDIAMTRETVLRQLKGQPVLSFENRYQTKSGVSRYLQWQGMVTKSACLVGIGRDITDEVRRSELLAKLAQNERSSLSAALHDGISQQLFGVRMIASQLRKALEREDSAHTARAALMEQVIQETLRSVRNVMEGLTPCSKDSGCLSQTLHRFCERIGTLYDVHCVCKIMGPDVCLDVDVANQLCLITQEAVMNAVKHASTHEIRVVVCKRDGEVCISIEDNGIGISAPQKTGGFGVMIMRDRATLIGASFDMFTNNKGGTTVRCVWLQPRNAFPSHANAMHVLMGHAETATKPPL